MIRRDMTAAITVLEVDPNFNAGKGSVFTRDGKNELDAAIMDGHTLRADGVAHVALHGDEDDGSAELPALAESAARP